MASCWLSLSTSLRDSTEIYSSRQLLAYFYAGENSGFRSENVNVSKDVLGQPENPHVLANEIENVVNRLDEHSADRKTSAQLTSEQLIRVLLADDHTMFREGLAGSLTRYGGMEVVGATSNDSGAVELARKLRPDVVIMQVQQPFGKAKENLDKMRLISPTPKVVIVTMFEDPRMMRDYLNLGIRGYLLKSSSTDHLIGAVRAAVLDPDEGHVVVGMPRQILENAGEGTGGVISARQLEVLLLAARGLSNRQIANQLYLAEGTIMRHLANTYKKMGVFSRSEAVRKALEEEWITISDMSHQEELEEW